MNKPVIKFFRLEFIRKFKHGKLLYYTKKRKKYNEKFTDEKWPNSETNLLVTY